MAPSTFSAVHVTGFLTSRGEPTDSAEREAAHTVEYIMLMPLSSALHTSVREEPMSHAHKNRGKTPVSTQPKALQLAMFYHLIYKLIKGSHYKFHKANGVWIHIYSNGGVSKTKRFDKGNRKFLLSGKNFGRFLLGMTVTIKPMLWCQVVLQQGWRGNRWSRNTKFGWLSMNWCVLLRLGQGSVHRPPELYNFFTLVPSQLVQNERMLYSARSSRSIYLPTTFSTWIWVTGWASTDIFPSRRDPRWRTISVEKAESEAGCHWCPGWSFGRVTLWWLVLIPLVRCSPYSRERLLK